MEFYGHPRTEMRNESWKLLKRVGWGRSPPWFFGGTL